MRRNYATLTLIVLSLPTINALADSPGKADPLTLPSAFVQGSRHERVQTADEPRIHRTRVIPATRIKGCPTVDNASVVKDSEVGYLGSIPEYHRPIRVDTGLVQPVPVHTFSYGWFGVPPRQHWTRHFGYYRNYTEWSAK